VDTTMNFHDLFKDLFSGLDVERFQRNFTANRFSKHKSNAKQPKADERKRKKIRRKMAKQSRRINRRK
jgi:hypothetical protein